jgi:hypothetical protein
MYRTSTNPQYCLALVTALCLGVAACTADATGDEEKDVALTPLGECDQEFSFLNPPERPWIARIATRISLDNYCNSRTCPRNLDEVRQMREAQQFNLTEISGCGVVSLQWRQGDLAGFAWNFAADNGELIGAGFYDDVLSTVANCKDHAFQAGAAPPLPYVAEWEGQVDPESICEEITSAPF